MATGTRVARDVAFPAALVACVASFLVAATPAGAVVVGIHGHGYSIAPRAGVDATKLSGAKRARAAIRAARRPAAFSSRARPFDELPEGGEELEWVGGPVMHSTNTHVVYWDPNKEFTATTKTIIKNFFTDVAADSGKPTNVFPVGGQYYDAESNAAYKSTFAGPVVDEHAYPASGCVVPNEVEADKGPPYTKCLTDEQLQSELSSLIKNEGLPKGSAQLYFLLLPHKVATCLPEETVEVGPGEFVKIHPCSNNYFCAYHGYISPGAPGEIIYADIPFSLLDTGFAKACQDDGKAGIQTPNGDTTGTNESTRYADVALKYISHEWIEAATDPLVNFETAWVDFNGLEIGDKCNGVSANAEKNGIGYDKKSFTPTLGGTAAGDNLYNQSINEGHFYIQSEWDNVQLECLMKPLELSGAGDEILPSEPAEGHIAKFTGAVTDPYEDPEFTWEFGDGSEPVTGEVVEHTYAKAGTYKLKLKTKDGLTDSTTAPFEQTVTVDEAPKASFVVEGATLAKTLVKFNAAASSDPDGSIEKYAWEFGDTGKGEGAEVTHEYKAPGVYKVALTIEDSSKITAGTNKELRVIAAPSVTTEAASEIGQTSATLNAKVNPNGAVASPCEIEYGTTEAYGKEAPCSPAPGAEFAPVAVSAAIEELEPGATYHYRVVTKNEAGSGTGEDEKFTTLAKLAPTASEESASAITTASATLGAKINPHGAVVKKCEFEYGTSSFVYEAKAPCAVFPGGGTSPVAVSAAISGLTAGTIYHFRVVAESSGGTGQGSDATFTTTTLPPKEEGGGGKPPPKEEGGKTPVSSSFVAKAAANAKTGAITLTVTVTNPGTFSWLATFANGKFGVFSASAKCKHGFLKLNGKCKPATIVFAKGSGSFAGAGTESFTLKPTASARKALATARKRKKGLAVMLKLGFKSSLGGSPAAQSPSITVKLKK
jgi:PKD repeat protein